MNLSKTTYVDDDTIIYAENMNDIQDAIIQNTSYATCTTAADTAAKVASVDNFSLSAGASVRVKFTYGNTVVSPTLNVNSTGAKAIRLSTGRAAGPGEGLSWSAGSIVTFVYDGTRWMMSDVNLAYNVSYRADAAKTIVLRDGTNLPLYPVTGYYHAGQTLTLTLFGYGYSIGGGGGYYFEFPMPYPILADVVAVTAVSSVSIRNPSGLVLSTNAVADLGIQTCIKNHQGFRIECRGITDGFVAHVPATINGSFTLEFAAAS